MKSILSLSAVLLLGATALTPTAIAAQPDQGRVHALVIGVDDYPVSPLCDACVTDAATIATLVPAQFGPGRTRVTSLTDRCGPSNDRVTWARIQAELTRLQRESTTNDYVYFYYSGHGVPGELTLPQGEVTASHLAQALARIPARMIIVLLDACYAGSFIPTLDAAIRKPSLVVVTAVNAEQTAKTCAIDGRACPATNDQGSVFTAWLAATKRDRAADRNQDGQISWSEVAASINTRLRADFYRRHLHQPALDLDMTPQVLQRLR